MMSHFSVGVHQHSISRGRPRLQRLLRGDDAAEQLSYDDDILSSRRFYSNGKYSRAARNQIRLSRRVTVGLQYVKR